MKSIDDSILQLIIERKEFRTLTSTHLRLAMKPHSHYIDIAYKGVLWFLATSVYLGWVIPGMKLWAHRYITVLGCLLTAITRTVCLIEVILQEPDGSHFKAFANLMQNTSFAFEGLIFLFYWLILSWTDLQKHKDTYTAFFNIVLHTIVPFVAFIPIFVERTTFTQRELFLATIPMGLIYLTVLVSYAMMYHKGVYDPFFRFTDLMSYGLVCVAIAILIGTYYVGWIVCDWVDERMTLTYGMLPEIIEVPPAEADKKGPSLETSMIFNIEDKILEEVGKIGKEDEPIFMESTGSPKLENKFSEDSPAKATGGNSPLESPRGLSKRFPRRMYRRETRMEEIRSNLKSSLEEAFKIQLQNIPTES